METAYEKFMAEHSLTISDLSEDAKNVIKQLKKTVSGMNTIIKQGRKPTAATLSKIETFDKMIVREILDTVESLESARDEKAESVAANKAAAEKAEAERIAAEKATKAKTAATKAAKEKTAADNALKDKIAASKIAAEKAEKEKAEELEVINNPTPDEEPVDSEGLQCDAEFEKMVEAGNTEVSLEELKNFAPVAYNVIFDNHVDDLSNGITTTYYILSETTKNKFKLSKV